MLVTITLRERNENASAQFYKRIGENDIMIAAALDNCNINMHCTHKRPRQMLQYQFANARNLLVTH
jgi:hypothetical protein